MPRSRSHTVGFVVVVVVAAAIARHVVDLLLGVRPRRLLHILPRVHTHVVVVADVDFVVVVAAARSVAVHLLGAQPPWVERLLFVL